MRTKLLVVASSAVLLCLILVVVVSVSVTRYFIYKDYVKNWFNLGEKKEFLVTSGMNCKQVADSLKSRGIFDRPWVFRKYMEKQGLDGLIQPGMVEMYPGISMSGMANAFVNPERVFRFEFNELCDEYELGGKLGYYNLVDRDEFIKYVQENNLQGYLCPGEHWVPEDKDVKRLVEIFKQAFYVEYRDLFIKYFGTPYPSEDILHDILVRASIVQMEGRLDSERFKIAALIQVRLNLRKRLEMDTTSKYAIKLVEDGWRYGKILRVHTRRRVAGNTYRFSGLPPYPICNPGRSSIEAVLQVRQMVEEGRRNELPEDIYMMAKKNGSREHYFTDDYSQHLRNKVQSDKNYVIFLAQLAREKAEKERR